RRERALKEFQDGLARSTDRLLGLVFLAQWCLALALALAFDRHAALALVAGGLLAVGGLALALARAGPPTTRHALAVGQGAWSVVFSLIGGGVHDGVLAGIAALAVFSLYRDWRVLVTITLGVLVGQVMLGTIVAAPPWVMVEHLVWFVAADACLIVASRRGAHDHEAAARRVSQLTRAAEIIERKVRDRTMRLEDEIEQYRAIVENTDAVAFEYDTVKQRMMYIAPQAARLLECEPDRLADREFLAARIHPDDRAHAEAAIVRFLGGHGQDQPLDCRLVTAHDRVIHTRTFVSGRAGSRRVRGLTVDITRQRQLEHELQQAQKLESVGRLAAGVAHEINTPIQFVGDSVEFVRGAVQDMLVLLEKQRAAVRSVLAGTPSVELALAAEAAVDDADLPYLLDQLPEALARAVDGVDRVGRIVRSMKVFAHPDKLEMVAVDLNRAIDSTLTIACNEYRYVADVVTRFGELPPVWCYAGDISQVVLNIIINATDAIREAAGPGRARGQITVTTRAEHDIVTISVADTGGGIPEEVRAHIFEPFFTTKEVGKGTGQGLAIARSMVVERYGGKLWFETEAGIGTTFHVELPNRVGAWDAAA
nr:ATP-binding protein [Myxococcota bacterium]